VWCVEGEEGQNIIQRHGGRQKQTDRKNIEKKQGEVKFLILEGSISTSTIPRGIEMSAFSKGVNKPFP
jgi:hypothetical protein